MFEAVECYGWIVNNNIHGLEVVTEKKRVEEIKTFFIHPNPAQD